VSRYGFDETAIVTTADVSRATEEGERKDEDLSFSNPSKPMHHK
jgi:hypothetical protein